MNEPKPPIDPIKFNMLETMVQGHHGRLLSIDKTLGKTPDPKTLRHIEHVVQELPPTDDIKEVVKHYGATAESVKQLEKNQVKRDAYLMVAYVALGLVAQYLVQHF